ncbi:hypothetical protein E2P81_ATG05597 [Venturia nashicola]|uniref:Uncharacterized protein n=1 Tax=Venturia nashicola TaxID=86259 RepID=A0A4Z1P164_9PEZI|nr:hypothetical protein E6O75_ATG05733 [Venturia nashicola]TLD32621.1 hypothetical protein E2P81_ATG05597 [Venturia nashicola]
MLHLHLFSAYRNVAGFSIGRVRFDMPRHDNPGPGGKVPALREAKSLSGPHLPARFLVARIRCIKPSPRDSTSNGLSGSWCSHQVGFDETKSTTEALADVYSMQAGLRGHFRTSSRLLHADLTDLSMASVHTAQTNLTGRTRSRLSIFDPPNWPKLQIRPRSKLVEIVPTHPLDDLNTGARRFYKRMHELARHLRTLSKINNAKKPRTCRLRKFTKARLAIITVTPELTRDDDAAFRNVKVYAAVATSAA